MSTVSSNKSVAIVVLNWNCAPDTITCIESLLQQSYKNLSLIIVDNFSSDNSVEILQDYINNQSRNFSIVLLRNTVNSGFAGGINFGFKYALTKKYDFIGTLNPDATADENWVKCLVKEMNSSEKVGIAGGKLIHPGTKTIDSTGEAYSKWGLAFPMNRGKATENAPDEVFRPFGITGGAVLYRSSLLRDIGMFDESLFMYYEDIDLSFRAQLKGYQASYNPNATAYHRHGASTDKVPGLAVYQTFKNLPLVMIKNIPSFYLPTLYPRFVLAYGLILINAIMHGRGSPAFKGWLMSFVLLPRAVKLRLSIQKNRSVSNEYIRSMIWPDLPPDQTGLRKIRKVFTGKS